MNKLFEYLSSGFFGAMGVAWIISAPVGIVTAIIRDDAVSVALSIFIPLYGSIYALFF